MQAQSPTFLDLFLQNSMYYIYWGAAIVASAVFVVQTLSLFIGFDTDHDFSGGDTDFDADGLNLISVKTVACFILGFGWTGVIFYDFIDNKFWLMALSLLVGLVFMVLIAFLLRQVLRLSQDNTFRVEKTLGHVAEVYLSVPAAPGKNGKIIVSIEGSLHELLAVTTHTADLQTGSRVRIVEVIDEDTVRVEPASLENNS